MLGTVSVFCDQSFLIYHDNFPPKVRIYKFIHPTISPREVSILHFFFILTLEITFCSFLLKSVGGTQKEYINTT